MAAGGLLSIENEGSFISHLGIGESGFPSCGVWERGSCWNRERVNSAYNMRRFHPITVSFANIQRSDFLTLLVVRLESPIPRPVFS